MPKETFYNLNEEKKEKIEKAIINEFSRNSFEKASISNIIEEAKIPRGSFYQYFDDKEDAVKYIIEKFMNIQKQRIEAIIHQNKGDIFKTSIDIFEYIVNENIKEDDMQLCKNIFQKLKEENISILEEVRKEASKRYNENAKIDEEILNISQGEEIKYMIRILTSVIRMEIIDVISRRKTKEQGRNDLEIEIEILKKGMKKAR